MVDTRFFKNLGPFSLKEIEIISEAKIYSKVEDASKIFIEDIAPIESASSSQLTFLSNHKYAKSLKDSEAGFCIMAEEDVVYAPENMILLVSKNPYYSYTLIAQRFYSSSDSFFKTNLTNKNFIDPTSSIGENCQIGFGVYIGKNVVIGNNCYIGHNSVIENGVIIGDNVVIMSSVSISYAIIGDNVIIHSGVRIGQDGFGYAFGKNEHNKIPQLGRVIIGNKVEIGANSCIDRGAGPDTIIGDGTKIDNLVQIGHNVEIGANSIIVSQVGISGSTKIGTYAVIGGQVGIAGHLSIGHGVQIAAKSGISKDIDNKQIMGGFPALPIRQWHRQTAILKRLIKKNG